jgi:TrmH family RNA methyltransferase
MLTSPKNPKIQRIVRLQSQARVRRREGVFIVEGVRLTEEAFLAGWQPELVLYSEQLSSRGQQLVSGFQARGVEVLAVSSQVMRAASDTHTPQGILTVLPIPEMVIPAPLKFAFIPDGVRDPGNLGTMLRTALAAGVDAVLYPLGTVDPYAPKVVRSAMGAHFHLPIVNSSWDQIRTITAPLHAYLADASAELSCYDADFSVPLALIIGGEADGAGNQARTLAVTSVKIPMPGPMESLNAAAAGAVLMFEVNRQRQGF